MRWEDQRRSDNVEDRRGMKVRGGRRLGIGTIVVVLVVSWLTGANPLTLFQMAGGLGGGGAGAGGAGADGRAGRRSAGRVRLGRAGLDRRRLEPRVPAGRRALSAADARALQRRGGLGVRHQLLGGRTLLLSGRSEGLHRSRVLPRTRRALRCARRFCAGLRRGARGRTPPADACSASRRRSWRPGSAPARSTATGCRCCRNSRRTALPASGAITPISGTSCNPAMSRKACGPPPPSATTCMQKRAQGRVSPESWTHGSSEQRVTWLRRGLTEGTIDACDTFGQSAR